MLSNFKSGVKIADAVDSPFAFRFNCLEVVRDQITDYRQGE